LLFPPDVSTRKFHQAGTRLFSERLLMIAFERHYRVKELAALWGFCENTIIKQFANEPGVIRLQQGGRRKYATL
jgi:hypothetical protein